MSIRFSIYAGRVATLGLALLGTNCQGAARDESIALAPAEIAAAYAAVLRDTSDVGAQRFALDPRTARPESLIVQEADFVDTARLREDLVQALLSRPEIVGSCVPNQPGPDLAAYCDIPEAEPIRMAVRFTEPKQFGPDTLEFAASFSRVRPSSDTSAFNLGYAYGMAYRVARRGSAWVIVARRNTFET